MYLSRLFVMEMHIDADVGVRLIVIAVCSEVSTYQRLQGCKQTVGTQLYSSPLTPNCLPSSTSTRPKPSRRVAE